jgi:actin-related protein 3
MQANIARLGNLLSNSAPPPAIEVNIVSHPMQRYAVWFGGSMLASTVGFPLRSHQ